MAAVVPPAPTLPLTCPACHWHGLVRDAVCEPRAIVCCPTCGGRCKQVDEPAADARADGTPL